MVETVARILSMHEIYTSSIKTSVFAGTLRFQHTCAGDGKWMQNVLRWATRQVHALILNFWLYTSCP